MPRLKNLNDGIPNDFQIIHPEAGMAKPYRYPSFTGVVTFETRFRKGNPAICEKNGWTLDPAEIEHYVEQQNVQRLLAHGWTEFLNMDTDAPKSKGQRELPAALAAVAGHLGKLSAGKNLILQWLGDGLEPVPIEISEKRAEVCAGCEHNKEGDLWQRLTEFASKQLRSLIELKNRMKLQTSYDSKLKVCELCDCPLQTKVQAPINVIRSNLSPKVKSDLEKVPHCWVPRE